MMKNNNKSTNNHKYNHQHIKYHKIRKNIDWFKQVLIVLNIFIH